MASKRAIPSNRFERIVELASEGIWTLDADGRTDYINGRGASIFGYLPEEMLGRPPADLLFPEDQLEGEGTPGIDGRTEAHHAEVRARRKDGSAVWISSSTSLITDEDGTYRGALVIFSDISDRKMAEEALTFQAHLLTSVHDAIIATDEHFTIVYWNEMAEKLFGWTMSEAIGRSTGDLIRSKLPGASRERSIELLLREEHYDGEAICYHKDGREVFVDVHSQVMRDPEGGVMEIVSSFRDINDRKRAEEALRRSEESYRHIVQFAPAAIFELDFVHMRLRNVNDLMTELTGYSREELLAMDPIDFFGEESRGRLRQGIAERLAGKRSGPAEYKIRVKGGREIWATFDLKPLYENGRVTGALVVGHDVTEQRETREKLRESEERFRTILDHSRDGIYMVDLRTNRFLFISPSQIELTGFTLDELNAMTPEGALDRVHPDDREKMLGQQMQVMEGKDPGEPSEHRWMVKSGEYRWFSDRRNAVHDEHGEPTALVGTSRDITQRKREEQALHDSEERLSLALSAGHLATWDWNLVTNEMVWNDEHYRMMGLKVGEIRPSFEAWARWVHADDRSAVLAAFSQCMGRGGDYAAEYRALWPDGTVRWISSFGYFGRDPEGHPTRSYGVLMDITERKRAEMALRESEQRLRLHFDNSPLAVVEWNSDFVITRWVGEAERMFGYTADETIGRTFYDLNLIYPDDIPAVEVLMTELTDRVSDKAVSSNRNITKDGRVIDCTWYNSVLMDERKNAPTVLSLVMDNTARVEAERELIKNSEELARSNAELQQFAYVASHDLQEPLRMVTMYLSLLRKKYGDELNPEAKKYMSVAMDGAERMRRMVNDLLEYSRVDTKERRFSPVDMNALAVQVRDGLRIAIEEANALVRLDPLPMVLADEAQMRQLLTNLISNAIKFRDDRRPLIEVSAMGRADEWVFAVKDNGIGIDPRFKEKLFQMFSRLQSRDEYPGTGIGLAISKKIVERHGGRIWVDSDGRSGSTFFFTIPRPREIGR